MRQRVKDAFLWESVKMLRRLADLPHRLAAKPIGAKCGAREQHLTELLYCSDCQDAISDTCPLAGITIVFAAASERRSWMRSRRIG